MTTIINDIEYVEFKIEKSCKTCDKNPKFCYACGGWYPNPNLVPEGFRMDVGPTVLVPVNSQ